MLLGNSGSVLQGAGDLSCKEEHRVCLAGSTVLLFLEHGICFEGSYSYRQKNLESSAQRNARINVLEFDKEEKPLTGAVKLMTSAAAKGEGREN